MKTTFRNDEYVRAHGKTPRGYGMWAFEITLSDGNGSYSNEGICFFTGALNNAKRACKDHAAIRARECGRCKEILIDILS